MTDLAQIDRDLARLGPLVSFPWHTQQQFALAAATNVVMILGGNQSGKTTGALGIVSRLVRREGPIYRRLRNVDSRPLKIWVSPQTLEKYQSNWEDRLLQETFGGMQFDYVKSPHPVFTWDDACASGNTLWGKSQDQGFRAFESDVVDLVVFDEEPQDRKLYTSAQQRFATTNGVMVLAFTPLLGISWTHGALYVPTKKADHQVAPRVWKKGNAVTLIQMGMADNPASVAGGGVARIQSDTSMTQAEKNTRLYGDYGFAEGLIFPTFADLMAEADDNPYLLDELPQDRPYNWTLTMDPNKRHGGLLTAIDHMGNRFYVSEHYADSLPESKHAGRYLNILATWKLTQGRDVGVYADPGGAGAQAILNMAEYGVFAQAVPKDAGSVAASIKRLRSAAWSDPKHPHPTRKKDGKPVMGAPHVYFLRSLKSQWTDQGVDYNESRLMWELRQYRQKEGAPPDTPIKEKDDCVDPARYVELVRPYAPAPDDTSGLAERAKLERMSRAASDEFDELVKQAMKPQPAGGWE